MISNSGRSVLLHTSDRGERRAVPQRPGGDLGRAGPVLAVETKVMFKAETSARTCDGFGIPAVRRRRVEPAEVALAHILLFGIGPLLGVRVRVQVKGRGGQLGSTFTSEEINRPWASGAPPAGPGSTLEGGETEGGF